MKMHRILFALALMFTALFATAADLTKNQANTLRAAILAEPALAAAVSIRDDNAIATYCNAAASPAQKAWREAVPARDVFDATAVTEYIARSAAERQGFDLLLTMAPLDGSRTKVRNAVADIFSGASNSTSRAAILNALTESATWCEVKVGGANATTDTVTAWKRNWTGTLSVNQISELLN